MADQLIPTAAMVRDPRLRLLFALVGRALAEGDLFHTEDSLELSLLDIAPEYLPPDQPETPTGPWSHAVARELGIADA